MKSKKWRRRRNKRKYMSLVPKCCLLNYKQHQDMMFCWGILMGMKEGIRKKENCICDMSKIESDRNKFKEVIQLAIWRIHTWNSICCNFILLWDACTCSVCDLHRFDARKLIWAFCCPCKTSWLLSYLMLYYKGNLI